MYLSRSAVRKTPSSDRPSVVTCRGAKPSPYQVVLRRKSNPLANLQFELPTKCQRSFSVTQLHPPPRTDMEFRTLNL